MCKEKNLCKNIKFVNAIIRNSDQQISNDTLANENIIC